MQRIRPFHFKAHGSVVAKLTIYLYSDAVNSEIRFWKLKQTRMRGVPATPGGVKRCAIQWIQIKDIGKNNSICFQA